MSNALPGDCKRDRRANRTPHPLDRLVHAETLQGLAVEGCNGIASENTSAVGRHVVDWSDDLHNAIFHCDIDAETTKFAARLHLLFLELRRAKIAGMRVEPG